MISKEFKNYLKENIDLYKDSDLSHKPTLKQVLDILWDNDAIIIYTKSSKAIAMWSSINGWYQSNEESNLMDSKVIMVVASDLTTVCVVLDYDE